MLWNTKTKLNFFVMLITVALFILGINSNIVKADIIYVDADASGANNGTSWENAFNHLQNAISSASFGSEIWVAEGVYKPDEDTAHPNGSGNRDATFGLINDVAIKGGFAGFSEPNPNERDPNTYETILSGDLNGDDGLDFTNNGENSYNVVTASGTNDTAVLDGFTITSANQRGVSCVDSSPRLENCVMMANFESGVQCLFSSPTITNCIISGSWGDSGVNCRENSSPIITNCTIWGNSADGSGGGGIYCNGSSPTIINCTISGNSAGDGGGMCNVAYSNPTVTNCTFSGNWAFYGGGMYNCEGSSPTLANCTFSGNSAEEDGGGMWNELSNPSLTNCKFSENLAVWSGGGMSNEDSSSPTLTSCTFSGNSAVRGGGMWNSNNCNPTVTNCTFSNNSAENGGGGMRNHSASPTVTNCTFSGNTATYVGGGIYNYYGCWPTLINCILWENTASNGAQIYNRVTNSVTVSYSDVQGGWPGEGNINADPMFNGPKFGEPTEAPIAHWKLDEGTGSTAFDSVGNNDGTIYGAQWTSGRIDGALDFDGVNDYVSLPIDSVISSLTNITIATWVNWSGQGNYWQRCWDFGSSENVNMFLTVNNSFTGTPRFAITNVGNWDEDQTTSPYALSSGWHHLAVTIDADNSTHSLYIDGELVDDNTSARYTPSDLGSTSQNWLGRSQYSADPYFVGSLDDIRIYDRALSAEEVQQFYQMDYHLLPGSPCIDAGDNTAVPAGITTDLDGNPRFVDQPEISDTGKGIAPIVDMGAFEANYIKVPMKLTPQSLNPVSKGKWIKAHFVLPESFYIEDVDADMPAIIPFLGIEAENMNVFINEDSLVEIEAAFNRSDFCGAVISDEPIEVTVIGQLTTGQKFYGTDAIRITNNYIKYLAILSSYWLQTDCDKLEWCDGADLNQDSVVNFIDFALFDSCCVVGE